MAIDYSPPSSESDSDSSAEETTQTNQEWQLKEAAKKKESPKVVFYKTKEIEYRSMTKRIILQDENGPCALISICNVLILRGEITLDLDCFEVSEQTLLNRVGEVLVERKDYDECIDLELVDGLAEGIIVDVKFKSIKDFVFTPKLAIFDSLDIPLYHGWLVDPEDVEIATAIGGRSYDALLNELTALDTQTVKAPNSKENGRLRKGDIEEEEALFKALTLSDREVSGVDTHRDSNERKAVSDSSGENGLTRKDGEVINGFLKDNASQLTWHGLFTLEDTLKEDELCVFYRNNHFSTMLKRDDKLFTLVTDQGYLGEQDLVWERLSQINGDSVFITGNFKVFKRDSGENRKWGQKHAIKKSENVFCGINSEDMDNTDPDLQMAWELQRQVWAGETGSEVPVITIRELREHISSSIRELRELFDVESQEVRWEHRERWNQFC
ncbi:ubiquitin carboxyl-terminal hydrolase MINDY-1 isoform X1 [Capsella rubella]|nr:ubiquitin carboxyl-terminal hydrolase MINDY-1 isoform X1 [Capsella rubella]